MKFVLITRRQLPPFGLALGLVENLKYSQNEFKMLTKLKSDSELDVRVKWLAYKSFANQFKWPPGSPILAPKSFDFVQLVLLKYLHGKLFSD